jgi:pimeloyl-ACP methyl ester carboxylesterase
VEKKEGNIIIDGNVSIYYQFLNSSLLLKNRPLLIFLHEGLGSVAQWKDFPALLCEKVKLPALIFDREGYGKSSALRELRDWNYLHIQAQQALPEIFSGLKIESVKKIIIGHSDGGSIAIIYAGTFPENIIGVITEASHQFIEDVSVTGIREAIKLFDEETLKDLLKKYHGDKTDALFHGWADTWMREGFQRWNIEEYLEKINVPFLGIQGVDDQYGSYAQLESIKKHIAGSEICHIPDCGHNPHLQHKDLLVNLMSDFIRKLI